MTGKTKKFTFGMNWTGSGELLMPERKNEPPFTTILPQVHLALAMAAMTYMSSMLILTAIQKLYP